MKITILIFDRITALDAIGPYEVLSRLPGAELTFVAKEAGPMRSDTGFLGVTADAGALVDPADERGLVAALEAAAAMPTPNPAARAAAAEHDVRRQAERMAVVLERAIRR